MPKLSWFKRLALMGLCLILFLSACTSAPSKYDQVQKDTTGFRAPAAVSKQAEKGGTFNKFFPGNLDNYEVVPSQEKTDFAEYKLKRGDQTLAMLTINDTTSLPAAAEKYASAPSTIAGYPAVEQGTTATGLLVNGRYQVKVLSRDPSFTRADRVAWLQKFDLHGLAQLQGATAVAKSRSTAPTLPTSPEAKTTARGTVPQRDLPEINQPALNLPRVNLPQLSSAL